MARRPKPWFRKQNKSWYVCIAGEQINLGKDKAEAFRQFHELLAQVEPKRSPRPQSVAAILDEFLDWVQEERPKSFRWYRDFLQSFLDTHGDLRVRDLTPHLVDAWARGKGRRGKITAMKRALNWAVEMGLLDYSPIAKMKRPPVGTRKDILTSAEFRELMSLIRDQAFRDLLEFSWESGARPQEAKLIEGRHIEGDIVYIPAEEGKLQQSRTIYLTERAKILLNENWIDEGPIFRNTRGRPWTTTAVKSRFERLADKFGRQLCQYTFRHSWINRKLKAGVDSHIVAALAGHRDTKMIDRVYSKVAADHDFMLGKARQS